MEIFDIQELALSVVPREGQVNYSRINHRCAGADDEFRKLILQLLFLEQIGNEK